MDIQTIALIVVGLILLTSVIVIFLVAKNAGHTQQIKQCKENREKDDVVTPAIVASTVIHSSQSNTNDCSHSDSGSSGGCD